MAEFRPVWETYPTVVTGVRTHDPALPFACADHHKLVMRAFEQARDLGYRRPALVLDRVIDRLVEGRFGSGFHAAETAHRWRGRAGAFFFDGRAGAAGREFEAWYARQRPDVILTIYNGVRSWLREMRVQVPRDVGLIQPEWRAAHPEWAGMNQRNDVAGEAAVEMVISMIQNGYAGLPDFPRATLIGSTWVPGWTLRRPSAKRR